MRELEQIEDTVESLQSFISENKKATIAILLVLFMFQFSKFIGTISPF